MMRKRTLYFLVGLGIALCCLAVPSSFPGADYPFSGHMLRHTALLLVAGPLMALGVGTGGSFSNRISGFSAGLAKYPLAAWLTGIGLMWVWHLPALYNTVPMPLHPMPPYAMPPPQAMPLLSFIPLLHGISLLAGGAIFCWPVIMPYPALRLMPLKAVLYLSSACVFCSLLGLLITFAPPGTFSGVTATDQQAGGLIMWVPCCFIYLSASMYLLIKWFSQSEEIRFVPTLNNK